MIDAGRTLVPISFVAEALGAQVKWDGTIQTVTITKGGSVLRLTIGQETAYKEGAPLSLDVPLKLIGGRAMVPLLFVAEAFGADVKWDEETWTVNITSQAQSEGGQRETAPSSTVGARSEVEWFLEAL